MIWKQNFGIYLEIIFARVVILIHYVWESWGDQQIVTVVLKGFQLVPNVVPKCCLSVKVLCSFDQSVKQSFAPLTSPSAPWGPLLLQAVQEVLAAVGVFVSRSSSSSSSISISISSSSSSCSSRRKSKSKIKGSIARSSSGGGSSSSSSGSGSGSGSGS